MEEDARVDDEGLAGDAVGAAEGDGLFGDVFGAGGAAKHSAVAGALGDLGREAKGHAGVLNQAGGDAVHGNAWSEGHGKAAGEVDERCLRGGVSDGAAARAEASHRGDIDDAAPAGGARA